MFPPRRSSGHPQPRFPPPTAPPSFQAMIRCRQSGWRERLFAVRCRQGAVRRASAGGVGHNISKITQWLNKNVSNELRPLATLLQLVRILPVLSVDYPVKTDTKICVVTKL